MQTSTEMQEELFDLTTKVEDKEKKEGDETESTRPFVSPKRKVPRTILRSPFYRVLSNLIEEDAESIQAFRISTITKEKNKQAFLIHIDSLPEHHLFEGYVFHGRHFRIDNTYRTSSSVQHGLATIHYTELYVSETTGESIKVHAYLNSQGQYRYPQVRKYRANSDKAIKLKIKEERCELLKINMNTSIEVLLPLLNERQERFLKFKKEADELEVELIKLSLNLRNHTSLEAYKVKARKFIEVVELLNQYSELADRRGRGLAVRLKELEAWSKKIQDAAQTSRPELDVLSSEPDEQLEPDPLEPAPFAVEPKESEALVSLYDTLVQEVKELTEQSAVKVVYSSENLEAIQKKHEIIRKTNQQFIALLEFPDAFLNNLFRKKEVERFFLKIAELTTKHEQEGSELLKKKTLQGNLKAVEGLFILFGSKLDEKFYSELLNILILEKSNQKRIGLAKVCEFFNKSAANYRSFILDLSRQASYVISKEEFIHFCTSISQKTVDCNLKASVLFKLYMNDDLESFEMLLRHGADPNTWGVSEESNKLTVFSMFQCIIVLNNAQYANYLKLLLRYGANPNYVVDPNCSIIPQHHSTHSILEEKIGHRKQVKKSGISGELLFEYTGSIHKTNSLTPHLAPPLSLCVRRRDLDLFTFLLPFVSVDRIAYDVSYAISSDIGYLYFSSLLEPSSPIKFFKDRESAYALAPPVSERQGPFLNYLFYKDVNCKEDLNVKFEMLNMAYMALVKKLKGIDLKNFDEIYQRLFEQGSQQSLLSKKRESQRTKSFDCFFGCIFLLMGGASNLLDERQKVELFSKYYEKLFKKIEVIFPASLRRPVDVSEPQHRHNVISVYKLWGVGIKQALKTIKKKAYPDTQTLVCNNSASTPTLLFSTLKESCPKILSKQEIKERLDIPEMLPIVCTVSKSKNLKSDFNSKLTRFVIAKEFAITTPDSETPILGALEIRAGYAIIIFHPQRTCLIYWDDNTNRDQLEFVVKKFLNNDQEPEIFSVLQLRGFENETLSLVQAYLGGPPLSLTECQVTLVGGWSNHDESRRAGEFVRDYFKESQVLLNLEKFQIKSPGNFPAKKRGPKGKDLSKQGFYFVIIDSRSGSIKFSEEWAACVAIQKYPLPLEKERFLTSKYLDSVHLQKDGYQWSGNRLISAEDFSGIQEYQTTELCKLSQRGDLKRLKEFLETMTIEINLSPKCAPGWTALHYACSAKPFSEEHLACAELLIHHGADASLKNPNGRTPLDLIKSNPNAKQKLCLRLEIRNSCLTKNIVSGVETSVLFALYHRHRELFPQFFPQETVKFMEKMEPIFQ